MVSHEKLIFFYRADNGCNVYYIESLILQNLSFRDYYLEIISSLYLKAEFYLNILFSYTFLSIIPTNRPTPNSKAYIHSTNINKTTDNYLML